jgi:hypothetical protein
MARWQGGGISFSLRRGRAVVAATTARRQPAAAASRNSLGSNGVQARQRGDARGRCCGWRRPFLERTRKWAPKRAMRALFCGAMLALALPVHGDAGLHWKMGLRITDARPTVSQGIIVDLELKTFKDLSGVVAAISNGRTKKMRQVSTTRQVPSIRLADPAPAEGSSHAYRPPLSRCRRTNRLMAIRR